MLPVLFDYFPKQKLISETESRQSTILRIVTLMERVTLYYREGKQKGVARLRFRLVDGRKIALYHKTGYLAKIKDLEKYEKTANSRSESRSTTKS